jgi:uncharacterized lipoprotein YmbA
MRSKLLLTVAICLTCACASTPKINYYTFSVEPSGQSRPEVNLAVERLQTTEALSRSQILIRTSATEIEYYASDQWAGNLGELVQQKLVVEFGEPVEGRRALRLSGVVLACEQVDLPGGAAARMKLRLVMRDTASKRYQMPLFEKTYTAQQAASRPSAAEVVVALSRCLEDIAAEVANDVAKL